jgi:AcrR family transcriptional regulator
MEAQKSYQAMHTQILKSALVIFSLKGYSDATIEGISSSAGCNAITIFRHFGNKENLFYSVVEKNCKIDVPENSLRAKLCKSNLSKDLATIADVFFELIIKQIHILRIFINEGVYFPKIHKYIWLIPDSLKNFFVDYLNEVYPGDIQEDQVALIAEMFVGYITRQCCRYSVHCGIHTYSKELAEDFRTTSRDEIELILGMIMILKRSPTLNTDSIPQQNRIRSRAQQTQ